MKKKIIGIVALGLTALTVTACGTSTGGTNETASTTTSSSTTASTTTSNATTASTTTSNNTTASVTEQTTTNNESSNTDMVNEIDRTFKEVIYGGSPIVFYWEDLLINMEPIVYVIESGSIIKSRPDNLTFGDLSKMTDDEIINRCKQDGNKTIGDNLQVFIITDETGNNVEAEGLLFHYVDSGTDRVGDVFFSGVTDAYSGTHRKGEFDTSYILDSQYTSYNSNSDGNAKKLGLHYRNLPTENGLHVCLIPDSIGDSDIMVEYGEEFNSYNPEGFNDALKRVVEKYKEKNGYK